MSDADQESSAGRGPAEAENIAEPADPEAAAAAGPVGNIVTSAVAIATGALALAYSISLSIGTPTNPGPGMWPAVASTVLVLAGLWTLVFERARSDGERFTRGALGIGLGIVSLVVFSLLFSRLGFEIPTVLLLAFWLKVLGKESWLMTAAVSVLTTAAFYVIFVVLLGVPLPRLI